MEIQRILKEAIETERIVTVVYHGGSQPGTKREIIPLELYKNSLRARCKASNAVKKFVIDKLSLDFNSDTANYGVNAGPIPFTSLEQAIFHIQEKLEFFGWFVQASQNSINLFSHYKNGNLRKKEDLSISFSESVYDTEWDDNGRPYLVNERPSYKPWLLKGRDINTRRYSSLPNALDRFLTYAEEFSPSKPEGKFTLNGQKEKELLQSMWKVRTRRQDTLIIPVVTFSKDGSSLHNSNWMYDVGYGFRDAMDIKFEERVRNKKRIHIWTQGPLITFKQGDFIKSRDRKKSANVRYATPMGWDSEKNVMYQGSVTFVENDIIDGKFKEFAQHRCTQMEFLHFLITGQLPQA